MIETGRQGERCISLVDKKAIQDLAGMALLLACGAHPNAAHTGG
jgi:hypothetical protein